MTTHPVTNAEIVRKMDAMEKEFATLTGKVDGLAELIALNHAIKTGGSIINWVAKVVASGVGIVALYKYGLAAVIGQGLGK